jgi:hypothetical protein
LFSIGWCGQLISLVESLARGCSPPCSKRIDIFCSNRVLITCNCFEILPQCHNTFRCIVIRACIYTVMNFVEFEQCNHSWCITRHLWWNNLLLSEPTCFYFCLNKCFIIYSFCIVCFGLVWFWLLFYAYRHRSILVAACRIILTPENQLMVIGLKIWSLSNPGFISKLAQLAYQLH